MPLSKAKKAEVATRRAKLIELRLQGVSFEDQRILDLGYSDRGHATKDMIRALEAARDEEAAAVSVYRQQENQRLDALLAAVWKQATTERPVFDKEGQLIGHEIDMRAVDTVLKLMDRRAKLNGLDAPIKTEVSGPDGGAIPLGSGSLQELDLLIKTAGQTNAEIEDAADLDEGAEDLDDDA